jgi:hypothetical protein
MVKVQSGSFRRPNEVRALDHGRIELVNLGEMTVGRQILEPGWRWSEHVRPVFADRGRHELKGIDGAREVFALSEG